MQKDRSQSWIVISRGMNKYVNELPEENGKSIHVEEVTASTADPLRQNRANNYSLHHYSALSTIVVPIDQRKWRDVPAVKTTPQKTRFRDEKYARIWDTD